MYNVSIYLERRRGGERGEDAPNQLLGRARRNQSTGFIARRKILYSQFPRRAFSVYSARYLR